MFSLLVHASGTAWETPRRMRMPAERFAEYSGEEGRILGGQILSQSTPETLRLLEELPTFLMYELSANGPNVDLVRFGYLQDAKKTTSELVFTFREEGQLPREVIREHAQELGIDSFEFNRTHWALKDGEIPVGVRHRVVSVLADGAEIDFDRGGHSSMPLQGLFLSNYRAFDEPVELEFRTITLFFGYNSAGKSALIRSLPLIAASCGLDASPGLALDCAAARGSSFRDILSRHSTSAELTFGLRWPDLRVRFTLRELPDTRRQVVSQTQVHGAASFRFEWLPEYETSQRYLLDYRGEKTEVGLAHSGLLPYPNTVVPQEVRLELEKLRARLGSLSRGTHWLGSLRTTPPRQSLYGVHPRRIESDGSGADRFLAFDAPPIGDGEACSLVSQWYETTTSHRLEIVPQGDYFRLVLSPLGATPIQVPLVDTGEGMGQVLPVLVLGALSRRKRVRHGSILVIENPEVHLHPAAHANLAAFFCQGAAETSVPALIETHSENFLLRLQLAIAMGELSTDKVVVYWVSQHSNGKARIEKITFDDSGVPLGNWPPGVFSEDVEQARKLVLERRKKAAQ